MSNTNEKTSKKETNELLYNALGVMAAELAEDSFLQEKQSIQNPAMSHSSLLLVVFLLL